MKGDVVKSHTSHARHSFLSPSVSRFMLLFKCNYVHDIRYYALDHEWEKIMIECWMASANARRMSPQSSGCCFLRSFQFRVRETLSNQSAVCLPRRQVGNGKREAEMRT